MIVGILIIISFNVMVVGLVNPSLVLRWSKKPTRVKVLGLWFISNIGIVIIGAILDVVVSSDDYHKTTDIEIKDSNNLDKNDTLFFNQNKQSNMDSSTIIEQQKIQEHKQVLIRELESFEKGIDFSSYSGSNESLQIEIVLFSEWWKLIERSEHYEDKEVMKLSKQLKNKVQYNQEKELPRIRKKYCKIVKDAMWEHDIDVEMTSDNIINITGYIFSRNKNIKDFQIKLNENLKLFRFKQSRYRSYDEELEYTYYTTYDGLDSDPLIIN